MNYTEKHNLPGMLVLIDFEKAFDSISWTFIYKTLKFFGFGKSFLLSTTRRICPKYGEIQTGMYFFCIHRRPGTMDIECD